MQTHDACICQHRHQRHLPSRLGRLEAIVVQTLPRTGNRLETESTYIELHAEGPPDFAVFPPGQQNLPALSESGRSERKRNGATCAAWVAPVARGSSTSEASRSRYSQGDRRPSKAVDSFPSSAHAVEPRRGPSGILRAEVPRA